MTTWWTSDTHFSHANIIKYCNRPFHDVQEMNEALIETWNSVVSPDDVVYHLGDLALGQAIEQQIALTARLQGHKLLVPGNHDRIAESFEGRRNDAKYLPVYVNAGREILPEKFEHSIGERRVVVCHFPYVGDSQDADRYRLHRPRDSGLPIIHGHVHTQFAVLGREFNVGVDVRGFAPVDEAVIVQWLESLDDTTPTEPLS